jgi:hypothetical protein
MADQNDDSAKLLREIALIRARAEHLRDLAWQISDRIAPDALLDHAAEIERRAALLERRVAALKAEAKTGAASEA